MNFELITQHFLLLTVVTIGLIAALKDLKTGKIKNSLVLTALGISLVINCTIFGYAIYNATNLAYFVQLASNVLLSTIISFVLWNFKIWSAGDAKLFIAYSALYPLSYYSSSYVPYFPSSALLINIFLAGLTFGVIIMIKNFNYKKAKKAIKRSVTEFFKIRELFLNGGKLFIITVFALGIKQYTELEMHIILRFAITYLLYVGLSKIKKKYSYALIGIFFLTTIFQIVDVNYYFWKNFLITFLIVFLGRNFLSNFFENFSALHFIDRKHLSQLRKGDYLADIIWKEKSMSQKDFEELEKESTEISKRKNVYYLKNTKIPALRKYTKIDSVFKGNTKLNKNSIAKVRRLPFRYVNVYRSLPFGVVMFVGLIITIVLKGVISF
jgi:Flp pilus assembly protein protease CpaA